MIHRRAFIIGACCISHAAATRSSSASEDNSSQTVFVCSTADPVAIPGFSIEKWKSDQGAAPAIDTSLRNFSVTPYGTAFLRDRWLKSDGLTPNTGLITLGVHFTNGSSRQREAVINSAPVWMSGQISDRLAFKFDVPRNSSQIRVEFDASVNDSYVGRDNLKIPLNSSTLRLRDLASHVIQHEFGHALGLQHEQQFPDSTIQWNEREVIDDMAKAPNFWNESQTRTNILSKYKTKDAVCIGDKKFNDRSIMLYPIPSNWTLNGFSVGTNSRISDRDFACLAGLYGL